MIGCPTPLPAKDRVRLGHCSGGNLSAELLRDVFLPVFRSRVLARPDDQAILEVGGERLAFTTDSFIVKPVFSAAAISVRSRCTARSTISRWAEPSLFS